MLTNKTCFPKRNELSLKPSIVGHIDLKYPNKFSLPHNQNLFEKIDQSNFKRPSISELYLTNKIHLSEKSKSELLERLSNTCIKRITIEFTTKQEVKSSNYFLIFIGNLINKNNSIEEIELKIEFESENILNATQKKSWICFIKAIRKRLVKIVSPRWIFIDDDINELLYSNSNLKQILLDKDIETSSPLAYSNMINYIFTSVKHLDELTINDFYLTPLFLNSNSENKIEINTLIIVHSQNRNYAEVGKLINVLIEYAFIYKIETIKIFNKNNSMDFDKLQQKALYASILSLSNNPLNSVKKIIFYSFSINDEMIYKMLKSDTYNINNIPQIIIEDRNQELIIKKNIILVVKLLSMKS